MMEDDVEHLGNDLGIGDGSLSSSYSEEQSDKQSKSSKEAEVCTSSASGKDRFKKQTYHATTMQDFFAKRPKQAPSHLSSVIIANDEETSQKVTRQWTDPVRQKAKERRRLAQKKRRENQRSDTTKHIERVVGKIIDCQAARTGADMTEAEGRAAVLKNVMAILNPPKLSKPWGVEDDKMSKAWVVEDEFCE